ncbi:MAG: dTDP-glucose 4,6-dehydratase [Syntrophobacteraceae bacterium]|nr:dTDP-glucose 4,6-dehydratase [Desulfobacteraceae bacterium]
MSVILVTGGAGFIGSNFILSELRRRDDVRIVNLDCLTYAGNPMNLAGLRGDSRYLFIHGNIGDGCWLRNLFERYRPEAVVNFAAETHVDRSILGPEPFVRTNVMGTCCLLEEARCYWESLPASGRKAFRFLHISTDEVYGSLKLDSPPFTEENPFAPNSPYSASKAAADHFVRAYGHTYGLPTLTTNCSNNYGPRQFPEKMIPLMILNALEGKALPVYGDGRNVRDWLFVEDHCDALHRVLTHGRPGETYNIGGHCEKTNLEVVTTICRMLDAIRPKAPRVPHESLITFVEDRPGHDLRYAIDSSKIEREVGWTPKETFETGLERTIRWYIENPAWVAAARSGDYHVWIKRQYAAQ